MNRHERRVAERGYRNKKSGSPHSGSKKGYHKGSFGSPPEHRHYPPYKMRKSKEARENARLASGAVPRHPGGK